MSAYEHVVNLSESEHNNEQLSSCACQPVDPRRRDFLKSAAIAPLVAGPCAVSFAANNDDPQRRTDEASLLAAFKELTQHSSAKIARIESFTLTPKELPWTVALGPIREGQQVSFFLTGRWWFVKEAGRWLEPGFVFFARVRGTQNKSAIYNTMQNTGTLTADRGGQLEIARSVGEFASPAGELWVSPEQYLGSQGQLQGIAIIWDESALSGLYQLAAEGDIQGFFHAEIQRQRMLERMPKGWHNFFSFGDGSIFSDTAGGDIDCYTHKNVGILQYPLANQPLKPGLILSWSWVVDRLPSKLPEDQLLNHDYLSIAVEFDDGQDITYMWSSQLPVGKVFRCPIPGWDQVETHVVQRSGSAELGVELTENVDVYADYQRILGGPATRVVKVWLIANTLFMRQHGRCSYRAIHIGPEAQQQQIL